MDGRRPWRVALFTCCGVRNRLGRALCGLVGRWGRLGDLSGYGSLFGCFPRFLLHGPTAHLLVRVWKAKVSIHGGLRAVVLFSLFVVFETSW